MPSQSSTKWADSYPFGPIRKRVINMLPKRHYDDLKTK